MVSRPMAGCSRLGPSSRDADMGMGYLLQTWVVTRPHHTHSRDVSTVLSTQRHTVLHSALCVYSI